MKIDFSFTRFLSHDCSSFEQFVKYGVIGVMATVVQTGVFYLLAATCLKCLEADDWAVRFLHLPAVEFPADAPWYATRWFLAAVAVGVGFTVANLFCWLMNRLFVFRPGKYKWFVELALFYGAALFATTVALTVQSVLISKCGLMTTAAVLIEVAVSFLVNFFARKFFIFNG